MGRRSTQLMEATKEFLAAHDRWADPKANRPDDPDTSYWEAYDAMVDVWDNGDIPNSCRELHSLVEKLSDANDAFNTVASATNQNPGDRFWGAVQSIRSFFVQKEQAPKKKTEPLRDLVDLPGMTTMQVAKMYGFIDRHGNPMPHLVSMELEKPGSVTQTPGAVDGRDWFDPLDPPVVEEADDEPATDKLPIRPKKPEPKPCPESLETLFRQGVSVEQAAKMLIRPPAEIHAEYVRLGAERQANAAKNKKSAELATM